MSSGGVHVTSTIGGSSCVSDSCRSRGAVGTTCSFTNKNGVTPHRISVGTSFRAMGAGTEGKARGRLPPSPDSDKKR